ncbi:MAG: phage holin family protein [Thiobacillus sp.]|nr:phage holin family protein [Thiobacillus sp.]MDP2252564.1 phage holin family protein [Thiobacillus sp.]MDP2978077.1 phage holin family protein [Thiobacillus sp.]MDZ7583322.1 phage holin family protein [Thiobacillus sp.]
MSDQTPGESRGLLESLSTLAATLVAIVHTRLDLLSADVEEGGAHVLSLLVLALAALFFIGVGVVLAAILLVVAFWDSHRLLALGALAGFFLAAGVGAWAYALHKARTKPRLFAASLSELLKDRQQLVSRP